jgi:hypothetical protein
MVRGSSSPALADILVAAIMAVAVVLPPSQLAVYTVAIGAIAFAIGISRYRAEILDPWFLAIFGCLVAGATFCLMGTLPVHQKSDIQLEFLKFGVYAAGFLSGFVALRTEQLGRRFAGLVIALIIIMFVVIAVKGGAQLRVDQGWPFYPPDQNNSVIIMITLTAGIAAITPIRSRMFLLFLLAVFVAFFESRVGLVVVVAMIILQFRTSPKITVMVLIAALAVWGYMSYGALNPQTKLIFATQSVVAKVADALPGSNTSEPAGAFATPLAALPLNRPLLEIGTNSDASRIAIYRRALEISANAFPNLTGMGDAAVVKRLNDPPLTRGVVFQHAHNFLLQSYLAYGLIATLFLVAAVVLMTILAIRRHAWNLLASLVMMGGFGLMEALTSDIRVLTVISIFLGGRVAIVLAAPRAICFASGTEESKVPGGYDGAFPASTGDP